MLFASVITLLAQTTNPFIGQWELNASKSKFSPGPGPKSQTVTYADDKTTVEGIESTGKPFKWSYTPSPGDCGSYPRHGELNGGRKNLGQHNRSHMDNGGMKTYGHGVVSKDGKTLKYVESGKDDQGRPVHYVYILERK